MTDRELFSSLPLRVQQMVLRDWWARTDLGWLRGEGLYSHAGYLGMIAAEQGVDIEAVCALGVAGRYLS